MKKQNRVKEFISWDDVVKEYGIKTDNLPSFKGMAANGILNNMPVFSMLEIPNDAVVTEETLESFFAILHDESVNDVYIAGTYSQIGFMVDYHVIEHITFHFLKIKLPEKSIEVAL